MRSSGQLLGFAGALLDGRPARSPRQLVAIPHLLANLAGRYAMWSWVVARLLALVRASGRVCLTEDAVAPRHLTASCQRRLAANLRLQKGRQALAPDRCKREP